MGDKANVVLVHGAWADGSSWSKVIPLLQKQGINVVGAQLPLTSLDDDVRVTKALLATQPEPVVLVGHSYGGVVISNAAMDAPNVKGLVFVAAFGLDEGESVEALGKQGPPPPGAAQVRPDDRGFLWIDRDGFAAAFAGDVDPIEARMMAAVQAPTSVQCFGARSGPPAWKRLPSWYLVATNDRMIPPEAEKMMGQRMGATVRSVPASHAVMVSHPKEVSDLIVQAVDSIGRS
jgi:pimeloyl-ACP methyl ester carboxylesterase